MVTPFRPRLGVLFLISGLLTATLWAYWTTLTGMADVWTEDAQYSHGYLVPLFALALLWSRRREFAASVLQPTWWAVPFLLAGTGMQLAGGYIYSPWLERVSLLPTLTGVCLGAAGWRALRLTWPAILFLVFMIPLPGRLEKALASPLQHVATLASTNALQTFGFFAQADGNVIVLKNHQLGVAEACSGLRMLVVFLATSTAVAVVIRRPCLQRTFIVLSSIPIAVLCNVIRITATGILHETAGHDLANKVYHNLAGWLMAPLALVFLWVELLVLRRLFLVTDPGETAGLWDPQQRPELAARA
jgi:exosortase